MLKSAIRDDNPVCFFEHKALYTMRGEVPDGDVTIPLGQADIKREGSDVTVIAWARMVHLALEAAEQAERDGISVEVIDPRGLRPLDTDTILASVAKTGRVLITHEAGKTGGASAEIAAIIAEEALTDLEAPIKRLCGIDTPIPQSMHLEQYVVPTAAELHIAIKQLAAA
jgi:Pyruvate/2-oxoglutarate dehydrogenase complex, dehydrogenase (E1) component, eukaryotic type, beta subunit